MILIIRYGIFCALARHYFRCFLFCSLDHTKQFGQNIAEIRSLILEASPETEFILCATTMPNTILKGFYGYQDKYYDVLKALECPGTAIASFYHMQKALLEKKRFIDMTGNNVNHPNDFMIRCHAQNLACMLIQK